MTLPLRDGNGDAKSLKTTLDGSDHVTHQKIDSFPGTVETDVSASKGFLQTLAGIVSGGRAAVDLSTTAMTYLANLTNIASYLNILQAAVNTGRIAVDLATTPTANLATIASAVGNLATIVANQGVPSGGPKFGQHTSIVTGSDAQFPSQALVRGMVITNLDTTNNLLVSHQAAPSAGGSTTRTIKPGMSSSFIACANANTVYMRSSAGTIAACYDGA